ncbi:hypothetical protein NFI96_012751 [Prochilodus magdalenae]|nr:hypothetical protein NFI96_012751 [Prochilodus magdalenae]
MSLTSWFLVSSGGTRHRLPREMIFVGRDDCELMLQSRSVDKQHAVINYEPTTDEHKVKDLGSLNGVKVTMYKILKMTVMRGELHVPEEALRHEKFSSQLQIAKMPSLNPVAAGAEGGKETVGKLLEPPRKGEDKVTAGDIAVVPRGTPLYGQPSWWGDADDENSEKHDTAPSDPRHLKCESGSNIVIKQQVVPATIAQTSTPQEPSYFEIPSKEAISAKVAHNEDLPLTEEGSTVTSTIHVPEGSTHGHASFIIEFNKVTSSKGKERSTKSGQGHRSRPNRGGGEELTALQVAMVAAEVKVADWLAQNDLPLALSESVPEDDGDSVKSDVPVQIRSLRGSKHEDGTQSDSENVLGEQLGSQRASLQDRERTAFCSRGDIFQSKPSSISDQMPQVGNEVEETSNHSEHLEGPQRSQADEQCNRGAYSAKLENNNTEEEKARCMIDKLLSDDLVIVGGPRWVSQWASLAAGHIRTDPEGSGAESTMTGTNEKGDNSEAKLPRTINSFAPSCQSQHKQALPQDSLENSRMDAVATEQGWAQHRYKTAVSEKQDEDFQNKEGQLHGMSRAKHRVAGATQSAIDRARAGKRVTTISQEVRHKASEQIPGHGEKSQDKKRTSKGEEKETSGKPLLRQESFTMERPSANVPVELIPCIDGPGTTNHTEIGSISKGIDADTLLKDSEAVVAFLETTLSDLADPPSFSLEGSVSPESDIDTTSTTSQAGAEAGCKVGQTKRSSSGPICDKSKITSGTKVKSHPRVPNRSHSRAWASLDLTDGDSSFTQDTFTVQLHSQAKTNKFRTEAGSIRAKEAKSKTAVPALSSSKTASMSQPRPTRASLLRRARLGESCDTDLADVDRMSVASEASTASSASRPSAGRRTLSRIETLAQPRRARVSSPSARSDSEATSGRIRGSGSYTGTDSALQPGLHSSSMPRARANSASKLPDKFAGKSIVHGPITAGGKWRRVPIEYASTSEDEVGSNRILTKHTRPRPITPRVTQLGGSAPATPSPGCTSMLRHQSSREQDDYMRDWTAHSEEIARISQDLAKDLAILAQEIHDVAGEIDSGSPSSAPSVLIEEPVFLDGLSSSPEITGTVVELRPQRTGNREPRAIRCQTWNRDEAVLDSLELASVSQLSAKIRQGVDKTASKIRILFKDKDKKWGELESKLQMENEVPLLKTSNQGISSIFSDLKRVERQLLVIDIMVDPDGTLDALSNLGITSPASEITVGPGAQNQSGSHQAEQRSGSTPLSFTGVSEMTEQELGLNVINRVQDNASRK